MYRFLLFCLLLLGGMTAQAQTSPDYQVRLPNYTASEDGQTITMRFSVYNKGAAATETASAEIIDFATREVIIREQDMIPPLQTGQVADFALSFPASRYPAASTQQIEIVVGRDEIESSNASTFIDNRTAISVQIPNYSGTAAQPLPTGVPPTTDTGSTTDAVITVPGLDVEIDLNDDRDRLILGAIAATIVIIFVIIVLILRVLFSGAPSFGNWQPPYANMPPLDPNSTVGRRQQWQPHAQNNIVPVPCQGITARKVLVGMDGQYLSGWSIKALRLTQYDMYGRVSRSQVLASRQMVKRLDRLARRAHKLKPKKIARRVRPVAKRLARQFKKRINKRSAPLAVALDARLQGQHGEVRILFELYDCRNGQPVQLDGWEPEMTVLGKAIHESYTFTLFGQHGGETYRQFRKRLPKDVERSLTELFRYTEPVAPPSAEPTPPQAYQAPPADALSSTQPVARPPQNSPATEPNPKVPDGDVKD